MPYRDIDPLGETTIRQQDAERFFAKISPEPMSGCHLWEGACRGSGYACIRLGGRTEAAHRIAWQIARGAIPAGMHVLHRCDNRICVNVDHLFLGTHQDNQSDKAAKGRGRPPGQFPYGASQASSGRFKSRVCWRGRIHYLGTYDTADEASDKAKATKERFLEEAARRCYACSETAIGQCASCDRRYCTDHGGAVYTGPVESSCDDRDYGESFCETCSTGEGPEQ